MPAAEAAPDVIIYNAVSGERVDQWLAAHYLVARCMKLKRAGFSHLLCSITRSSSMQLTLVQRSVKALVSPVPKKMPLSRLGLWVAALVNP